MFAQFQVRYPTGSLISELITIYHGKYVVRVLVQVDGVTRASGMATDDTIEQAEDQARIRAMAVMGINLSPATNAQPAAVEFPKRPSFASEPLEPSNLGNISSDPSWLNETTNLSFPQKPTSGSSPKLNATPTVVSGTVTGNLDWQRDDYVQNPDLPLSGHQSESSVVDKKVTPIGSRRHDREVSTLEPIEQMKVETTYANSSENTQVANPVDLSDAINRIPIEMKRLGWTTEQGREYLLRTYKKRSRSQLNDEELLEFLGYLESLPSPMS